MMKEKPTVLIVEEVSDRLKSVLSILENQPLSVYIRKDCETAGQKLNEIDPDLIIMDLSSQFAQKRALCERIFAQKPTHVKVLFIVPKGFPELIFASKAHMAGYITKPFYAGDVLGKLHAALYDKYLQAAGT